MSRRKINNTNKLLILYIVSLILSVHFWQYALHADNGDELITKVQSESLISHVKSLQENVSYYPTQKTHRTRNAYDREATEGVVEYIKGQFQANKRLQISEQNVGGNRNIIAVLPPKETSTSKRVFIVCAHYDTKADREPNWNPLASIAPGANKNGTGIAAMLEIASILSQYEYDHEIKFIAFGGEEIGFQGSRNYVNAALHKDRSNNEPPTKIQSPTSEKIAAVFNLDMIGFNWKSDLVEVISNRESLWISRALAISNTWFNIGLKIRRTQDEFIDISSHKTFWDAGYSAVTLIESSTPWRNSQNYDANPYYHTYADTVDKINFQLVEKVTQLVLVTIDSLLTQMFQSEREIPIVTLEIPDVVKQNPLQISGTFQADFPIDIIVHPSNVLAELDKENNTYTAMIPLSPGKNTIHVVAQYPLGAASVKRTTILEEGFFWKDILISPNPVRFHNRTEFRVEANLDITEMKIIIYDVRGNLIKRIDGVGDRLDKRIWRTWWNQQTSYGLAVSGGVYICQISVVSKEQTYTIIRKLAIMR